MSRHRPRPHPRLIVPGSEDWRFTDGIPRLSAKLRVAAVAGKQFGRVRSDQLRGLGIAESTIRDWCKNGYLFRELPRVYAVGHAGRTKTSDLAAAVLYAGPGAELSHATTIHWLGLLKYPPPQIHVSTPRRIQNQPGIVVHGRRTLERIMHKGLPITTPNQAIVDFAATGSSDLLRLVLANAEFQGLLDVDALNGGIGQGIDGTKALRAAIRIHLPQLALTRSRIEQLLLILCQRHRVPIPDGINVYVHGWLVDAVWHAAKLVVEIDETSGHRTPAQIRRDRRREFELRAAGYTVLRYTEEQLLTMPARIAAEIASYL